VKKSNISRRAIFFVFIETPVVMSVNYFFHYSECRIQKQKSTPLWPKKVHFYVSIFPIKPLTGAIGNVKIFL
jgi:hypothetical protein